MAAWPHLHLTKFIISRSKFNNAHLKGFGEGGDTKIGDYIPPYENLQEGYCMYVYYMLVDIDFQSPKFYLQYFVHSSHL